MAVAFDHTQQEVSSSLSLPVIQTAAGSEAFRVGSDLSFPSKAKLGSTPLLCYPTLPRKVNTVGMYAGGTCAGGPSCPTVQALVLPRMSWAALREP